MSKSRGNVINPDVVIDQYGADSLRLYEMFMGPLEATKPWSMKGVEGVYRFLGRAWRMIVDQEADDVRLDSRVRDTEPTAEQARFVARTVAGVTDDLEAMRFNTAISKLMEFTNEFTGRDVRPKTAMETFTLLLAPMAPHLAEELWQALGHAHTLAYDAAVLGESRPPDGINLPVLVLTGGGDPFFEGAADALAHALPNAERETLLAQGHVAGPKALAPVLERFYRPRT